MMNLQNKVGQHISLIVNHSLFKAVFNGSKKIALEVTLVVASKALLELVVNQIIFRQPLHVWVWNSVVLAPVAEEMVFRGILQEGIHIAQRIKNHFAGYVSEEDLKAQEVFRVHQTAFFFGIAHAHNSHADPIRNLYQCTNSYVAGTSWGYLKERHNTLSISILVHGFNNASGMIGFVAKAKGMPNAQLIHDLCFIGACGVQVFLFLLTRDYISFPSKEQLSLKAARVGLSVRSFFKNSSLSNLRS